MKRKTYLTLFLALTVCGAVSLNGCGFGLPGSTDNASAATELSAEQDVLTDGSVTLHTRWYDADGNKLANATVTIRDGRTEVFSGTTDENGNLEYFSIPGNTEYTCEVTDESGETLAESDLLYKISGAFDSITILTTHGEEGTQEVDVPADKTDLSAAIYLTENKTLSHANLTPYVEDANTATDDTAASDDTQTETTDGAAADGAADGTATDGTAADGTQTDGAAADPAQTDGTAADGTTAEGTQTDPAATDASQTDGAAENTTQADGTAAN